MKTNRARALKSYAIVAGMAFLMGWSYELFVFPNAFAPAGINGLATMVQYLFHISIGYLSLLINIPLILLAWRKLDPDFARKSLLFVLVFSGVTLALNRVDLSGIAYRSGSSAILGPVAAGVVSGAVYGFVIRQNGSTGGTDIVAAWVRKKHPEASLVWVIFGLNASVAALSFFVYGYQFEPVILCLIYCYLSSRISDGILKGGKTALKCEVVTQHANELSARLLQELRHGVTVLPAEGMYSETPRSLLICVVNRHQVVRFQEILSEFPDTFAYVSSVNETMGNFKRVTG
nr:YitT family protein [uncultured Oscillibacter sp.]